MSSEEYRILRVAEAKTRDVGRGIARIDPRVFEEMNLTPGDAILIEGTKKTAAIVMRGYPDDEGKGIIRIDGHIRKNAGVGIDDKVKIKKVKAHPAKEITLAPTEPLRIYGGEEYLKNLLEGRVITKGDRITINVMGRTIDFVVTSVKPFKDVVIVTSDTSMRLMVHHLQLLTSG